MNNPIQQKPMRTVWQSLLWKEWHEHKWKLVWFLLLILLSMLLFWKLGEPVSMPESLNTTLVIYSILGGLFLGMHTAAGENGRGTMQFLQTLPVPMQKPAAIRLLVSWVTLAIPVLVVLGLAYAYLSWYDFTPASLAQKANLAVQHGPFSTWGLQNWLLGLGLSGILCVSSLLLWMAATGVNRADEIGAGAMGFLTIAIVWFCLGGAVYQAQKAELGALQDCVVAAMATAPGGPASLGSLSNESHLPQLALAAIAVVGHACVLAWYLHRFGRKAVRPARTLGKRVKATKSDWLAPPRRSQLTAIIWKQVHETGSLALVAAAAILVMSCLAFWSNMGSPFQNSYSEMLAGITFSVGFLVTVVAGMGVFLEDLKPKVGNFWRSRPVNITTWFFVKFFTGLAVLVVTFGALILLAIAFDKDLWLLAPDQLGEQVANMAVGALVFVLIYTLSMAIYCLGRQPITAVVLVMGILFLGVPSVGYLIEEWVHQDWQFSFSLTGMLIAQVAATAVAWLTLRNNWGWHRS